MSAKKILKFQGLYRCFLMNSTLKIQKIEAYIDNCLS